MKSRLIRAGYILAFLAVCAGMLAFLLRFTQAEAPFTYPAWETGAAVSAAGTQDAFDPAGPLPELEEGEFYRFTMTLPAGRENGTYLIFETAGLEAAAFLDGAQVWYSSAEQSPETANLSQVYLPLPAGGGETLTVDLRPLSEGALVPPLLRLSADPSDQAGTIAYANYYGLPAGASALAMALMWGLFLLGISHGKRDWPLLLPILAAALLTAQRLAMGHGSSFLPEAVWELCTNRWLEWIIILALALYLLLCRDRAFRRALGRCAAWSAGALALVGLVSHLRGGYLARYLADLFSQLRSGIWSGALYWLTWWLVLVCAALSAWQLARFLGQTQGRARALALKNQLAMDNYRALEEKLRETARLRHGFAHQVAALDAMVAARDWEGMERWVSARRAQRGEPARWSEHIAVNAILQDAASRAQAAGIAFQATAAVPGELFVSDEDLCALLMNLLDNALEGAARTPAGREKAVWFRMRLSGNFLPIFCENTFDGRVETDETGELITTKADRTAHGFGVEQIRAVAKKYESILDVSWTQERFTVQTALQKPLEQ